VWAGGTPSQGIPGPPPGRSSAARDRGSGSDLHRA